MTTRLAATAAAAACVTTLLCAAPAARADLRNIADLYNTGVDNSGLSLTGGSADPHYLFAVPPPSGLAPVVATSAVGFPIAPAGPWLGDSPTSTWLVPSPNTTGNAGDYVYRTSFTIPANVDTSQVYLTGRWASDNDGRAIRLNGQDTGISNTRGFSAYSPQWAIKGGFNHGVNTLDFVVNEATGSVDNGGFTGLRVEMAGHYAAPGRANIASLRNSGVDAPGGAPLPNNAVDPSVILGPSSAVVAPVIARNSASGFPIPPWVEDNRYSAWLVPSADANAPEGDYYYQTTFNLTGLNPDTVEIYGRWATDNGGVDVLLNDAPTGNPNGNQFPDYTDFVLSTATGQTFLPGLNTLTFVVNNAAPSDNPSGVRWEFLSATAQRAPEPGAVLLLAAAAVPTLLRRRHAGTQIRR